MSQPVFTAPARRSLQTCLLPLAAFALVCGVIPPSSNAQSILDRLKAAAAQAKPATSAQPAKPATPAQPGQPAKPGQPTAKTAQPATAAGDTGPFTPPAGTLITPLVVGPASITSNSVAISPMGVHVSVTTQSGSRFVVLLDGVPGPKLDRMLTGGAQGGAIYSPDGNHSAYCAAIGTQWVVFEDGAQQSSGPAAVDGEMNASNCQIAFTSNSKHLYYSSVKDISPSAGLSPARFVWDGKPGPWGYPGNGFSYVVFSPDGNHAAFPFNPPGTTVPTQQFVVDNLLAPYKSDNFLFTGDGMHIFSTLMVTNTAGHYTQTMAGLIDGKTVVQADSVRWFVPPVGTMAVAVVTKNGAPSPTQALVMGGAVVPGSQTLPSGRCDKVVFSPDGKHYAAFCRGGSGVYVFTDGKKQQVYQNIGLNATGDMAFTADSSALVYLANNGGDSWLVTNGEESDALHMPLAPVFAPKTNHVLVASYTEVLLDGKALQLGDLRKSGVSSISFSPDGQHYAFVVQSPTGRTLYRDGVAQSAYTMTTVGGLVNNGTRSYVWSPDSNHIAYMCRPANPAANNDVYACIDDKAVHLGSNYSNISFSADSNHVFWGKVEGQTVYRVFIDGKPVYEGMSIDPGGMIFGTWEPQPDGSLRIIVHDDTNISRISIMPSSSTSLASALGN